MPEKTIDYSVILAAGKGTRFRSALPKVLHTVLGRTMLENAIRAVAPYTRREIIVVAGFGIEQVQEALTAICVDVPVRVAHQEVQMGTGHATEVACNVIDSEDGTLLVLPGDSPLLTAESLDSFITAAAAHPLSVLSVEVNDPTGFGRIVRDENKKFLRIVEHKDASEEERAVTEINASIYAGPVRTFKRYVPQIKSENVQKEFYLTDIVALMIKNGESVYAHTEQDPLPFSGANTRRELHQLETQARAILMNGLMEEGVTIESPSTTIIDADAHIEADVFIGAGTRILGKSHIASGVHLEGDTLIRSSKIGAGSYLRLGCYLQDAEIAEDVTIGPFAQIRPGSSLGTGVRIGNFVEVKNSNLEAGVKANHFSYLGDIDVGTNSNIGAGTIVCNYDGVNKHRSTVKDNCFVGSNSTLVSPIELGSGAYVGAGSVITKNVPTGALAVARSRQENKEGWAERRRKREK